MNKAAILCLLSLLFVQTACAANIDSEVSNSDVSTSMYSAEGWVKNLLAVHQGVLQRYQKDQDATQAFIDLQRAGIAKAIEQQPDGMDKQAYVNLLNDFAFFRYESTAFKTNVPLNVHLKNYSFVGNERMLRYDDIPNATMRLNRLCEAKHILQKVIELDPERTVAYLNLGDVYWRSAQYEQKLGYFSDRQGHEGSKAINLLQCKEEMKKEGFDYVDLFKDFFAAYDTYKLYQKKMVEQGKGDKVPERITKLVSRKLAYTVVQDNGIELGDQSLCVDYEKALNALSDDEIDFSLSNVDRANPDLIEKKLKVLAEQGIDSFTASSRRGDITQYDSSFKRIAFSSLPGENQKAFGTKGSAFYSAYGIDHPDQVFERNGNIYVDTRNARGLQMIHTDPEVQRLYGLKSRRCVYSLLDFKRKIVMAK